MPDMPLGRVSAVSALAGAAFALGVMAALAARAAWTVTRAGRWYQLKNLFGTYVP